MSKRVIPCLTAAMATALLAPVAPAAALAPIRLGTQALSAGQIRTTRLRRLESAPRLSAYGIVLDPGSLARRASQVIAAGAQAALARSEARRAAGLYRADHNISQAALQSAHARLQTAAATLMQLQTRMLAHWGPKLSSAALSGSAPVRALEAGTAALVEVSLPLGQGLERPPENAVATTPDGEKIHVRFISRAPRTAAGVAGETLFYLMPAESAAPIGAPLTVTLEARAREAGVLVSRSAVVWDHGEMIVFRETAPGTFLPVSIRNSFISGGGYFVPEHPGTSLHPGDRIVTGGAALLDSAAAQMAPANAEHAGTPDDGDHD